MRCTACGCDGATERHNDARNVEHWFHPTCYEAFRRWLAFYSLHLPKAVGLQPEKPPEPKPPAKAPTCDVCRWQPRAEFCGKEGFERFQCSECRRWGYSTARMRLNGGQPIPYKGDPTEPNDNWRNDDDTWPDHGPRSDQMERRDVTGDTYELGRRWRDPG